MELALDERDLAGQDVAVDVVEQVERDQQRDRANGGAQAGAARLSGASAHEGNAE